MRPIRGIHLENIIESLREYQPEADVEGILKAYTFASKVHGGQTRLSGQPYMNHPMEVAMILTRLKMEPKAIATSLLHDTVEDTSATTEDIKKHFGDEIAAMVEGLTKLSKIKFISHEQRQAENVRKMILAMSQDIRIVIIKLADRLHNMRTLEYLPPQRQNAISEETLDIYAPLANRLGISWLKAELEDLAFKYVYPVEYGQLKKKMEQQQSELDKVILTICNKTHELLRTEQISGEVTGRTKHLYSIYSKMRDQNLDFEQVHDVIGVRIITNSNLDCYKVLGLIHSTWKPVPGMMKDYIAVPKDNMYQSMHTTVVEPSAKRVEFQIRTQAMHNINEDGIAAHWRYKDRKKKGDTNEENFVWVRRLLELGMSIDNPEEFIENVKTDLFPDEVYVFTPQQEVLAFPKGCTPLDFAYAVHTDIGHKCKAAIVNSKEVPLDYPLQNGDTVEIITSHEQQPSREWLKIVRSSPAKAKILSYIRAKEKTDSIKLGRAIIEAEIKKYGLNPKTCMTDEALHNATEKLGFKTPDQLLQKVGFSKVPIYGLLEKLLTPKAWDEVEAARKTSLKGVFKRLTGRDKRKTPGVLVGDVDNMLIRFAGCCNPVPGDSILGYVSGGQGMVIHNKSCPLLKKLEPDPGKYIEAQWDLGLKKHLRPVRILAYSINRPGILASVSTAIADCEANISNAVVTPTDRKGGRLDITVEIEDLPHLERVIKAVKNVGGVKYVNRIMESATKE